MICTINKNYYIKNNSKNVMKSGPEDPVLMHIHVWMMVVRVVFMVMLFANQLDPP